MMKRLLLTAIAVLRLASAQQPDAAAARPAFAVASVKPTDLSLGQQIDMRALPGGTVTATAVTLKFLITVAYGVQNIQISGGPGWLDTAKFDILAKPDANPADGVKLPLLPMLQSLLEDRFKLVVRRETRELSVYELKLAKSGGQLGPNLKESSAGACPVDAPAVGTIPCGGFVLDRGRLAGNKDQLSALTKPLSGIVDRPVVDKTGLTQRFDLILEWSPDMGGAANSNSGLPSIFTALQEQLGLRLEPAKEPTEVLVVDRAEKPSEN
jgi:uncharacterized protein (TIGR03435 family)